MPSPPADDSQLLIRCPSCGQRFKVGEDLRGRTVECGACEHRFRIDEEVILRSRKVYPGERDNSDLNRFQRVPLATRGMPSGIEPVRYGKVPDPAVLEPMSPLRILAGIVGVSIILFVALLLMFATSRGGMLDGMKLSNKLVMGGFVAVLGTGMLIYANPKARIRASLFGLLISAGLLTVPFFFNNRSDEGSVPGRVVGEVVSSPEDVEPAMGEEEARLAKLRIKIGTGPLEDEIERLKLESSEKRAVGIWLRGMSETNRFLVRDYILRVTRADPGSHPYPRDGGDYLMVVTGITDSLQEVAEHANALGNIEKIYPELSVVEVKVRNENFVEGPMEKLSNKQDPEFYILNKTELESIDLTRVERAVERLADSEPRIFRADITRKLLELLGDDAVGFKPDVCAALLVWSEEPGPAGDAALAEVSRIFKAGKEVPPEMIALIVRERNPGVISILDRLWFKNPLKWEAIYMEAGPPAEATMIARYPETEGTIRYSATRILGKVGGADSLPVLVAAADGADSELRVLIGQAEESIRSRLGDDQD